MTMVLEKLNKIFPYFPPFKKKSDYIHWSFLKMSQTCVCVIILTRLNNFKKFHY